eukprot:COSAG02_NODE_3458_length_6701_cov_2.131475_1_plen_114_part_00
MCTATGSRDGVGTFTGGLDVTLAGSLVVPLVGWGSDSTSTGASGSGSDSSSSGVGGVIRPLKVDVEGVGAACGTVDGDPGGGLGGGLAFDGGLSGALLASEFVTRDGWLAARS